ncbi:MAG: futalosine hydrolase [Candidatus Magnetoovum sp. WYHC-5]|nr:futalosine hydrolase [Candidatus Magnetoovum sp. WYHC-5]
MLIYIFYAVSVEATHLLSAIEDKTLLSETPKTVSGKLSGHNILAVETGIGKVNAAHAITATITQRERPNIIINFGIAGAYPNTGLAVGDIAICIKEIYADEGLHTENGILGMQEIGIPILKTNNTSYYNEFPLNKKLAQTILSTNNIKAQIGTFITLSSCTTTNSRALYLQNKYNALCETMEGAAIAHICTIYNIPLIAIRGISNIVEKRNKSKWNIPAASKNCTESVILFLNNLKKEDIE